MVNSVLSSLNSFFDFCNWHELKVKMLKIQKQIFAREEKELTKAEYERLLTAARSQKKRTVVLHYANNMCLRIKGVRTSPRHN